MDLYSLLNIGNNDVESSIKTSIEETISDLNGLIDEGTCKIYSSYLYKHLKDKHIVSKIVDTKNDLLLDYQYWYVEVPVNENSNYVIDLTYSQFGCDEVFSKMYNDGYQLLSNEMYEKYLSNIKSVTKMK